MNMQELEQQFQDAPCTLSHDELKALRQYHQAQADFYGLVMGVLVAVGVAVAVGVMAWIVIVG